MLSTLLPIIIYLAVMLGVAVYVNKESTTKIEEGSSGFIKNYFIGDRSMGGFVLAMTLVATYTSGSSFVSGPGVAYSKGFAWVFLAMIQIPTAFLTLGVLGKKLAVVARKIQAVTIVDYIRARYKNDLVVIMSAIAIIVFFTVTMVAQFVAGATLFQSITGYSYTIGLVIFGIVVVIYTTVGGFKTVALTDAIQGVVMTLGIIILLASVSKAGGGVANIVTKLGEMDPALLEPTSGGTIPLPFIFSFWILVGFAVLGLPQTTVRCIAFKDSTALHKSMIYGTVVGGFVILGIHLVGVLGRAVMPGIEGSSDLVLTTLTLSLLHPVVAGFFVAAPLAAVMSTVDSLLISTSASIIKDLYLHYSKNTDLSEKSIGRLSLITTAILGTIVFIAAFKPPSLIIWINIFAFGGLQAAFLWPTILGLFWKKANATGVMLSMVTGVGSYFFFTLTKIKISSEHQIVPTIIISLAAFVIGSYFGKPVDQETLEIFWPSEKKAA